MPKNLPGRCTGVGMVFRWKQDINDGYRRADTRGYRDWNVGQMLVFGGFVKVEEYSCIQMIVWINIILNYELVSGGSTQARRFLLVYRPE